MLERRRSFKAASEDPVRLPARIATKLHTVWLQRTYPFADFGKGVSIHYSCDISRTMARLIFIGRDVYIAPDVWLNIVGEAVSAQPKIVLGHGSKVGRRSVISAKNHIELERDVLLAPNVLIMDHNHEYGNPDSSIHEQGVTEGGRIAIHQNCWVGYGAVIFCGSGELSLGRNSVVGANSVVTKSVAPFTVVAGNPARAIKKYDEAAAKWVRISNDQDCGNVNH